MSTPQSGNILKNALAQQLNKATLADLIKSPDTQRLMEMLNRSAGGGLKSAAEAAVKGDPSQLMGLVDRLKQDPEGAKVMDRINQSSQK